MTRAAVMDMPTQNPVPAGPSLVDRLRDCANAWGAAHDAKPSRLGLLVVNDSGFFSRLAAREASTTTATLEKFARFLAEPENWPDGTVPGEVREFTHVVGITAPVAPSSTDNPGDNIGAAAARGACGGAST